jgi:mRNA interferase YafQ
MRSVRTTRKFERDLKLAGKRGKNLAKLWSVVERIHQGVPLDPRHRPHRLSGAWVRHWECHIESDWLLIWHEDDEGLILVRSGTHADLFD